MQSVSEDDLNALGEQFAARLRSGERPNISEFTSGYSSECAEEIEDFLESIALLEGMKPQESAAALVEETFPRKFGRYEIQSSLGEGGMGTVYLAHDSQLDRKVALKTPKFDQNSDPNLMARFHREAKSAATLRHPNICPVYDVGQIDGIHYISMAYIEGRPLSDHIRSGKVPSVLSVIRIVRKVALALHEAHTNGLIHRDLKPANIMIDARNEPIVMDFGLARQFGDASMSNSSMPVLTGLQATEDQPGFEARLTQEGTVVGSPGYMSPEQLLGDPTKVGPASDVYALGSMFYELLTGRLPFPGDGSLVSIVNAVLSEPAPDASQVRSSVTVGAANVCRQALAKKTNDRFQSMQTFAVALTGLLKSKDEVANEQEEPSLQPMSPGLVRTKEQYELSKSLYQEGQFAAAASIMEKMVETAGRANQFTTWAGKQLPKAKAKASRETAVASSTSKDDGFWQTPFEPRDSGRSALATSRSQRNKASQKRLLRSIAVVAFAGTVCLVLAGPVSRYFAGDVDTDSPAPLVVADLKQDQQASDLSVAEAIEDDESKPGDESDTEPNESSSNRRTGTARASILERIWRLDTNDDSKLSKAELGKIRPFQGGPVSQLMSLFDNFDTSPTDSFLDSRELQRLLRSLPRPGNREGGGREGGNREGGRESGPRRRPEL
ncbi:MAG: serine/threonine-protein kinase [Fuerstiella sp.]